MEEKRVKQLINQIERIRKEVAEQEAAWQKENDGSEFGNAVHHSCIDSMGLAARDLGRAKNHLDAIVS